jgi:hypothetical protein
MQRMSRLQRVCWAWRVQEVGRILRVQEVLEAHRWTGLAWVWTLVEV